MLDTYIRLGRFLRHVYKKRTFITSERRNCYGEPSLITELCHHLSNRNEVSGKSNITYINKTI